MSSHPKSAFDHDFERGMRNRRAALGDAWVDQSVAKANAFNAEFQHYIDRKSTRLNSSHIQKSRMPSSA